MQSEKPRDYHLAGHNGRAVWYTIVRYIFPQKKAVGKKGSQPESVDRQLTDVIEPSSRLGGLLGKRPGVDIRCLGFYSQEQGYRPAIVIRCRKRGESRLLSSIYSWKRKREREGAIMTRETSVAKLSILAFSLILSRTNETLFFARVKNTSRSLCDLKAVENCTCRSVADSRWKLCD